MQARNPLVELRHGGQTLWLDRIERRLIDNKTFDRLIAEGAVGGALSNLEALKDAITSTDDYWAGIAELKRRKASAEEMYERLLLYDVARAAHTFRSLYRQSGGSEGYVSICVSPRLVHDSETTIHEARRLWKLIDQPNVMIAVAGTPAGIHAMQQLVTDGINVNVTPLFSVMRYAEAINAYAVGLQQRLNAGDPIDHVAVVSSFWPAALDYAVDTVLDAVATGVTRGRAELIHRLHGQTGLACATLAYHQFQEHCDNLRWRALASRGAHKPRLLWILDTNSADASLRYVDALDAANTISAVSLDLLERYRVAGNPRPIPEPAWAHERVTGLTDLRIDLQSLQLQLENRALSNAVHAYDELLGTLATKPRPLSRGQSC
jgi:transaldolase